MGHLSSHGIKTVQHHMPLHYLPFVNRSCRLLSKASLVSMGFSQTHFRSRSRDRDVSRGFAAYVHMTIDRAAPILEAKLRIGFPHITISVPANSIDAVPFSLCRFNVAMTRRLRRSERDGFPESAKNGRYYPGHAIPIARTSEEISAMLRQNLPQNTAIEVLVHCAFRLPNQTDVICYSDADAEIARVALTSPKHIWAVVVEKSPCHYPRSEKHSASVETFIEQALADPTWRGDGLEFDQPH